MLTIRSTSKVDKLLKVEKVLSVAGQLGGTNTRLALCTEKEGQLKTHVFKLQGKSSYKENDGLRKDLALMQDILLLASRNISDFVNELPITIGVAGFPSTRKDSLVRAGLQVQDPVNAQDAFYCLPNIKSFRDSKFIDFSKFLHRSAVPVYLKTENNQGLQDQNFTSISTTDRIQGKKINLEIINDGKSQARYMASSEKLKDGANLLHLILGTGSNFEAAHNWSSSTGNFDRSLNTEHGHKNVSQVPLFLKLRYIASDTESDGRANFSVVSPTNDISFEKAFAGGSLANNEFLIQGFFHSLEKYFVNPNREKMDRSPFIKGLKADIKEQLQYLTEQSIEFSGRDITQFYNNFLINSIDYSKSLEEAAKAGNKFALACLKLWIVCLADSINTEARLHAKPPENQKYHLSISGSHGLGLLGIKTKDFDAMEIFKSKLSDDLFEKKVLESRPKEGMDGLVENAELQARAALEKAKVNT